jgi:hypothetical protein
MFWPLFDEFGHLRNRNGAMECTDVKAELCTMSEDGLEVFTLIVEIVEINVAAHHTDGGLQLELSQQAFPRQERHELHISDSLPIRMC